MTDFGTTLSCVDDISPEARMVSGFRVVGEAVARRWLTPRGRLIGYPNYGFDLTQFVNADVTARDLPAIKAGAAAEALKDERVTSADVSVSLAVDGILSVSAVLGTALGPFTLVLAVSDVTIQILQVSP